MIVIDSLQFRFLATWIFRNWPPSPPSPYVMRITTNYVCRTVSHPQAIYTYYWHLNCAARRALEGFTISQICHLHRSLTRFTLRWDVEPNNYHLGRRAGIRCRRNRNNSTRLNASIRRVISTHGGAVTGLPGMIRERTLVACEYVYHRRRFLRSPNGRRRRHDRNIDGTEKREHNRNQFN